MISYFSEFGLNISFFIFKNQTPGLNQNVESFYFLNKFGLFFKKVCLNTDFHEGRAKVHSKTSSLFYEFKIIHQSIQIMTLLSTVKKILKRKAGNFLLNQTVPPPVVYFIMFFYVHYNRGQINNYSSLMLSLVMLKLAMIADFNCAFMAAPFLGFSNMAIGLLFFGIACLSCNEKWKVYLLLLAIGDALTQQPSLNVFYLAIAATYICVETYHSLIFRSIEENKQYFTGFFVIAVYGCIQIFLQQTNNTLHSYLMVLILGVSLLLGMSIIEMRIEELRATSPNQIRNGRLMAHHLTLLKQDIQLSFVRKTKIELHRRKCTNPSCFCRNPTTIIGHNYFIRQLYEDLAQQFNHSFDPFFFEDYLIFLANNGQVIKALHHLSAWKTENYFTFTAKLRCEQRIAKLLMDLNSSNMYEQEYQYALAYDGYLLQLMVSIHSILQEKLVFWTQVSRQNPLMIKMQEKGSLIIQQMYSLNCFYNQVIKTHEKKLYSFDATVIYSMYLLSTTNFKDYAELIIKNTSKLLEEVYVFENNVAETFAMRIRVQNDKKSYFKDREEYFTHAKVGNESSYNIQNNYKLIIDSVSRGFCRMIKISRNELIGEELNFIIPDCYKEVHKYRVEELINFDCEELRDIIPSKLLHKQLKLPIRGVGSSLIMGYICIKFMLDIQVGLAFISTIKRVNDKTKNALVTIEGKIRQKEQGFFEQILGHSEVKKYIDGTLKSWMATKTVKEEKFNLMINSSNYSITVNSPFLSFFVEKPNLKTKSPPIHIEVFNEENNKHKTPDNDPTNKMAKELKEMENAIAYQDNESSASTKSSTSAINTISTFSQSNSVPIYRYVVISYLIVVALCLTANLVGYLTADLSWDNTVTNHNPINDIINAQKLQTITNKLLLNLWDLNEFYTHGQQFNMTQMNSYFGPLGYQAQIFALFTEMESQMRSLMYQGLQNYSSVLSDNIQQKWSTLLTIENYFSVPSQITLAHQNLTYLQLMLNFVVDLNLLANQRLSNQVMIATSLSTAFTVTQNVSNFVTTIDSQINQDSYRSLFIQIAMIITIVLSLVPGWLFLRTRLPLHEKIFDLLVSVDVDMVMKEIQSLNYITNILKNYQESSEILKNNVMDYQENIIYPKRNSARRASVNNQIILGLEKYDNIEDNAERDISEGQSERQQLTKKDNKPVAIATTIAGQSRTSKFSSKSIRGFTIMREQSEIKQLQQQRKRDGELDYRGSQSDPSKKVLPRHMVFYLLILVFVVFLGVAAYLNSNYMSQIKNRKNVMYNLIDQYIRNTQTLAVGKLYFRYGIAGLAPVYGGFSTLLTMAQSIPTYNYTAQNGYSQIYPNCTALDANSSSYITSQKYCEYNYSYLIILGEYGALFKQSFENRYNADLQLSNYTTNNQMSIYNQIIYNISEKVFYMQSLNHQLQNMTDALVDQQFTDMLAYSSNYQSIKMLLLVLAVCWTAVCFIVGVIVIMGMKQQYFKEVYMITFLNYEMIMKSKRVESFLDSLSKSNN